MGSKMQAPEVHCMDPENYRKFFRALCWSGIRKSDRPFKRLKDRRHHAKIQNPAAVCFAPALLGNPSLFAVYVTVRRSILASWRNLFGTMADSDDSDDESVPIVRVKIPKVTGIGLRAVFTLVMQSRDSNVVFCEASLRALLDVVQGYGPEELAQEPTEIVSHIHRMLIEVAAGTAPPEALDLPTNLTALGTSCLISLVVARGEVELILNAVSSLIMSPPPLAEQYIQIPANLTTLQRSVQSVILGTPSRNTWLNYGVPQQSLTTSFPVDLPSALTMGPTELVVRALVSDGCYLYVFTSRGLLKIGSGYGGSIKQHVYLYKPDFFPSDRHGWLGFCKNKLYVRIGRKKTEVYEVDKNSLDVKYLVKLESGINPHEPRSAVFTDGHQLGVMMFTSNCEYITIRFYDVETTPEPEGDCLSLHHRKELNVPLLRKRTLVLGRPSYEDIPAWRERDRDDLGIAVQLDDNEDDPLVAITGGAEFGLLTTETGRVYYTGRGASLGYKASPECGRWTLMKETLFNKNAPMKQYKAEQVLQVAVGHEGVHAVLVLDNGQVLFTGVARRDEDGDSNKHTRRLAKPARPKLMYKAEPFPIIQAACNNGSTALVARSGELLMFGKDAQHTDSAGIVHTLRHEKITQVALGKAHTVALTSRGLVYTFGINNKGQCGREFGYTKEKNYSTQPPPPLPPFPPPPPPPEPRNKNIDAQVCLGSHSFSKDYCRVCVRCHECTGFASACNLAHKPPRGPGERCGCGEGDRGCRECGICRRCADAFLAAARPEPAEAMEPGEAIEDGQDSAREDNSEKEKTEGQASGSDVERDLAIKITCLSPARVAIPGGHKITAVACGLHHTLLITDRGEVLSFGSNQYGQLGAGDVVPHHKLVKVKVPKAEIIAAGSYHSAIMTREGEIYTFGNFQKGALGRMAEGNHDSGRHVWYATPAPVPRIGPKHTSRAVWVSASGDQTFIQVSQSVVKTETLFSSTIVANSTTIIMLPNRPEHTFKCVTIDKKEGIINSWPGPEQVDFVNTLACLDPLYDVIWCYQPQMRVMKCYNILAFDSHKLQRCCNPDLDPSENVDICYPSIGTMRRLEDFKNLEDYELISNNTDSSMDSIALVDMSILNQELAIPTVHGTWVTRMHIALHLLGCLDSLIYVHDNNLHIIECKREAGSSANAPLKADWLTVTRFETHGGGWGYSGHSVEAIRFMCDTDILLGGYGLFGGRGDYTAKIKLYDIGVAGGNQEGDGEVIAESDEVVYECPPRDRFPIMFDAPLPLIAGRWYVAWACISGPSSDCGSAGKALVTSDDANFHFKSSKKSNNGTDVNAGQIPSLLYNLACTIHAAPPRMTDVGEPVARLSRNLSRKITVNCFISLLDLLKWSWGCFRATMLDTHGLIPINYQKLIKMKHQKRLVYIIRACFRLLKSYVMEIYPSNFRKQLTHEYMTYLTVIQEARVLIQGIVAEDTPTCAMLQRRSIRNKNRICYVQFALELSTSILKEAHETTVMCFNAFYPNPMLMWKHLCSILHQVQDGRVPTREIRELTATSAAMCTSRCLGEVLHLVVPMTQSYMATEEMTSPDSMGLVSTIALHKSPMKAAPAQRSQQPPPIPPRANHKEPKASGSSEEDGQDHNEWHILDVITKLLDIVMNPIKQQMMTRPCGQPHDHGEIKQQEMLADYCCKLVVRIVSELTSNATNVEDIKSVTVKEMLTPSRFMRVNTSRSWNTGNGSPDAICFNVDRPGVLLVGVGVYSGGGIYEYSLELLHDMGLSNKASDDSASSNCWVSVEMVQGTFDGSECQNDMALIKFEKHVLLKEDLRYALRFNNHGGRTSNGDCGLPSVKGPDGTTFRFASCSLSYNGTTLARGQIPCLIYCGMAAGKSHTVDTTDSLQAAFHTITLRVSQQVLERSVQLFRTLRNELTAEDLKRNTSVLQESPIVNILIPYVLANMETIDDSKNLIKLLELIHQLLPHVAAVNLLQPNIDEFTTTTSNYYTWVESEHPYKESSITNMRVLFPSNVSWVVLEMDPRSITAQSEDSLTIYAVAGTPKQRCHCLSDVGVADPPFRKVYKRIVQLTPAGEFEEREAEQEHENACMHFNCTYVSVTPKLTNTASEWPRKALLIPGNEVIFALETVADYLSDCNRPKSTDSRFGFRCLCAGYEDTPLTSQRQGLVALELELVYFAGNCASKLLAPDLDVPPMVFSTLVDAQILPMEAEESQPDSSEALLLSRGLELSSPLSVHQVLDGQSLLRCVSTERQFLMDFIAGAVSTAGGRLARWLAPTSRVEPTKCEIKGPATPAHPAEQVILPILVRDQYGEAVASPSLKVEVVIQKHEESSARQSSTNLCDYRINVPKHSFQPPVKDTMFYQAISMMRAYSHFSFEELRLASGIWGDAVTMIKERVPAIRLVIKPEADGSYLVNWVPKHPGSYKFRCTLDDLPIARELSVDVAVSPSEASLERGFQSLLPAAPPAKIMIFDVEYSVGLRVRASPSLQAEELGIISTGSNVAYVEEVTNKDGTWVRLNLDTLRKFTDGSANVAWCMKHHQHLDKALLVPLEPEEPRDPPPDPPPVEGVGQWPPTTQAPQLLPSAPVLQPDEVNPEPGPSQDPMAIEEGTIPNPIEEVDTDEDFSGASPYPYAPEPSKRDRHMRNEAAGSGSPRRRSNGNEWCAPLRHRPDNGHDVEPIAEVEMEPESDEDSEPELVDPTQYRELVVPKQQQPVMRYKRVGLRYARTGPIAPPRKPYFLMTAEERAQVLLNQARPQGEKETPLAAACRISKVRELARKPASPPPLPARPPRPPMKHALSPAQAECLRAIFAALLWHEGIVHDAIACAAFLKFHPELPKQGAEVVTRPPPDVPIPRHQRHSVEVSNTGNYLRIQPSTLNSLPWAGEEAGSSAPGSEAGDPPAVRQDPPAVASGSILDKYKIPVLVKPSAPAIVNVLPPAMRALVALWDALYDSDQLSAATDKYKTRIEDNPIDPPQVVDEMPCLTLGPPRIFFNSNLMESSPYGANTRCELCGGAHVAPPLTAHMHHVHAGCRAQSMRGYNRMGYYRRTDPPPDPAPTDMPPLICGKLMKLCADTNADNPLWYIFCERCRDKGLKIAKDLGTRIANSDVNKFSNTDHNVMKENAIFLLDLAPLTDAKSLSTARFGSGRSPPTPPASMWQPAPSFQCMRALGAAPRAAAAPDTARYHSLGRAPPSAAPGSPGGEGSGSAPRVPRSVSMGQASDRELANAVYEPIVVNLQEEEQETLSGAGSSLISQPSAQLLRLVGCVEEGSAGWTASAFDAPNVNTDSLIKSPVLSFVLKQHDLPTYRQKLDAAIRISTVRQYAFEAMNWLMRSTTQPMGVHDVMWWFCAALEQYARLVPPGDHDEPREAGDVSRTRQATASTSAICPGGRSARGARAALHAFLGSVSALAPSLPTASPAALQAMRCWALHYSKHDRDFLHRSQVFSVISKILSHPDDGFYEDGYMTGAFAESFHSYAHKESYLWSCADVTAWCDISVSSQPAMTGCLIDGSTETFWESGEDDRNKAKWLQISFPGGTSEETPHIVCVHIDNTRDTTQKVLMISFLYSGGTGEMYHMQDVEIDVKAATWISYTLPTCYPGSTTPNLRVRCELRGPDATVRVRQVRMLAAPSHHTHPASAIDTPYKVVHALAEKDTLRVFRLLTAQVFGNLLAWDRTGESAVLPRDEPPHAGSDLREHVVGILFAGNQLTSLQRQVMTHIVEAIGGEAAHVRDDWETAFLCAKTSELNGETPLMPDVHQQDNYCFEMLSLLLALSGSRVGQAHLSQQVDMLWDLLTLLHIASDRVQRQVIFLLRRMMMGIPPQKLQVAKEQNGEERYTPLQHMVCYLGKAMNIQVKIKGAKGPATSSVMMGSCVVGPKAAWFMRGMTTKKHAQLITKLIADMAEGKISDDWRHETRTSLARYAAEISLISEADRHPSRCVALPTMWICLAALCVCEQSHIDLLNKVEGRDVRSRNSNEPRTLCTNHDDGATAAVIECRTCGALCTECDRFLHLKRAARSHSRKISKEEEGAIRIDIHEGCGRAKLFWLLLLVDRKTLKGLAEFRGGAAGAAGVTSVCRFCGASGSLGGVCTDLLCQEYSRSACSRRLACGHMCKGVSEESTCLPCLSGCSKDAGLRQDGDDMCMICFTDPLQAAPCIQLGCGHLFHMHCCKEVIANGWIGPRITFSFAQCAICKEDIKHWALESMLAPIRELYEEVKRKALMRFGYEGIELPETSSTQPAIDAAEFAMDRYAYYVCHKCHKAYFGGLARCDAEYNGSWDPSELVCGACSDIAGAKTCPKHASDFLEYKCRYCCSVAVFFCFGTTHFCNACHDDFQRVTNIPPEQLPQCPTGPKCMQLPGTAEECPLHVPHPATGDEFALGCGICRHSQVF